MLDSNQRLQDMTPVALSVKLTRANKGTCPVNSSPLHLYRASLVFCPLGANHVVQFGGGFPSPSLSILAKIVASTCLVGRGGVSPNAYFIMIFLHPILSFMAQSLIC